MYFYGLQISFLCVGINLTELFSPYMVDRDNDFGGVLVLLHHVFFNFLLGLDTILCFSQDKNRVYCVLASKKCYLRDKCPSSPLKSLPLSTIGKTRSV